MNIPEKWFFKGTEESEKQVKNSDYYKYFYNNFGNGYGFFRGYYYYSNGDYSKIEDAVFEGFTEISFEDFKRYILNQPEKSIELW